MATEEWTEAFTKAQAEIPPIPKLHEATIPTKTSSYSYKYADLNDILEVVRPILNKHGLSIAQSTVSEEGQIGVVTRIYHTSGHVEKFGPLLLPAGGDARSAGSAITYARRYGLCAALGISPDDDDDGEAAQKAEHRSETVAIPGGQPPYEPAPAEDIREEEPPERTDVKLTPNDWIKTSVEVFGLWTPEEKREAYATAMTGLECKKLSSMKRAKEVFEKMSEAYYEAQPEASPF